MSLENWDKIKKIFLEAVEITAPDERVCFLDAACAGDAELKGEVEKLIARDEEEKNLTDAPLSNKSEIHDLTSTIEDRDPLIGRRIGAYRLTEEIGRGGMGAVYLAERADGAFYQQVAVKLIKRGMDTDFILRRFRQERQILASLNHPFIARLLDGGTTEDNLPYFVMEFIEGQPLYKYSDCHKLNIRERLKLFRQICQAIDFAHRNQVIHRDIKPPNILVTEDGSPKLLDFGIAKVLDSESGVNTADPTATAMRLMTPEYASPEQVSGAAITPASDIYSLGVLLYELLTGHRPYRFQNRAPHEIARVICEQEPDRPSFGVTRQDSLLPSGANNATTVIDVSFLRGAANVEDLRRELSGDLEKIVLKSLRKEPGERYQTALAFAEDITRYLDGKPVAAETHFQPVAQMPTTEGRALTKSLAVLPLKILNLTPNPDTGEEFLSIGLADAMITRLSGVRRLAVRPTSAVLRYSDGAANPLRAGKELAVDFVLDGRIKILGRRIRISLQLLRVKTATSVWANQFDETFTDALELEDSISQKVIEAILPQLTDAEKQKVKKRGTVNSEAFEAYLRGRFFWNQFTPESLPKAFQAFQEAIKFDPNYALAYVGLADFYLWANIYGIIPSLDANIKAAEAARQAIRLDETLGEAYASLGLTYQNRLEWAESDRLYRKSLELNLNYVHAHEWHSAWLVGYGKFEKGIREAKRAERLDPLSLRTKTLTAWALYQARQFEQALVRANQIIEMDKNYPQGYAQLGINLLALGETEKAIAALRKFDEMIPDSGLAKFQLCFALVRASRRVEARAVSEQLKALAAETYVKPFFLAMMHAALDERETAFRYFEQSFAEAEPWLLWFGTEPMLEFLHDDRRYQDLLRRMNNPLAAQSPDKKLATGSEKSIAVLPLKLLGAPSEETGEDYLSIGLADALIRRLSNVRRFVVRPTSSVLPYGKKQIEALTAGKELGVDFIVDGTIRRFGGRVRVTAQLLSVRENSTRWAQTFDENFSDVLALEDSISAQVAKSLVPHLTGEEERQIKKRGTDSPEAFEAYLRGRHYWNTFTEEGFAKALIFYNQAISIAPDYALAYAGIADYYNLLGIYAVMPFQETAAAAKEAALKAIAADDTLAEGYAALGFAVLMRDFDWSGAERNLRRAVELNPNYVTGRVWYGFFLGLKGNWDAALRQAERAIELDPLTPIVPHTRNMTLYYARRFDEAIAATEKFVEKEPRYALGQLFLSSVLWHVGRTGEAINLVNRAIGLLGRTPYTLIWLASAYAAGGRAAEAKKLIEEIEKLSVQRYSSPYLLAIVYANLNDMEKALELLEKAWEIRDGRLVWLGVDPQFDRLRSNSRFQKVLLQTNNPLAWNAV